LFASSSKFAPGKCASLNRKSGQSGRELDASVLRRSGKILNIKFSYLKNILRTLCPRFIQLKILLWIFYFKQLSRWPWTEAKLKWNINGELSNLRQSAFMTDDDHRALNDDEAARKRSFSRKSRLRVKSWVFSRFFFFRLIYALNCAEQLDEVPFPKHYVI